MANFYFFTDIDLLSSQAQIGAFGPAGSSGGKDKYQVTSIHSSSSDSNAYAISDGVVCVQEDGSNANLVNLILKPLSQPPFAFSKIKFIIYRGIKKDSLFNGNEIAVSTSNDLTKSIWESQTAKNASTGTSENPPKEALGIDLKAPAFPDSGSIDDIFYRDNVANQFPVVKSGWKIGKFNASSFGIEILTESIGFDPKLSVARANKNIIEVNTLPVSPTQAQMFEHWHDKEEILNYIDPCAFFGCFSHSQIRVKRSTSDNSDRLRGNEVYDTILAKFNNKNRIYLDIRNEFNHSFNYFKNYGTTINAAFDVSSTPSSINYYRNGWPILILENSDFPVGNTLKRNLIRIQMPDGGGDNTLPLMYVCSGYPSQTYPKEPKGKGRFYDLTVTSGHTNEFSLTTLNRDGGATTSVSCYIKLKYNKRFDPSHNPASSGTVLRSQNYLDNIISPFSLVIPFAGDSNLKSKIYDDEVYIDFRQNLKKDFAASIGIAKYDQAVELFYSASNVRNTEEKEHKRFPQKSIAYKTSKAFLESIVDSIKGVRLFKTPLNLADQTLSAGYLTLETDFSEDFSSCDSSEYFSIILTTSQWNSLNNIVTGFIPKYRVYLGLINKANETDNNGISYTVAELALRGYIEQSQQILINEFSTGIKIFSHGNL
ncbi:hypothetical protein [Sporocytophaga myxococcoides]|uniref:hypothetical protein n=1 Tax=Sporocytophaga myxococcoides TaxID=153721 RepID=UPI00041FE318|nr:hypothetical protein [Sporocytophaga myxococcoides]